MDQNLNTWKKSLIFKLKLTVKEYKWKVSHGDECVVDVTAYIISDSESFNIIMQM